MPVVHAVVARDDVADIRHSKHPTLQALQCRIGRAGAQQRGPQFRVRLDGRGRVFIQHLMAPLRIGHYNRSKCFKNPYEEKSI
jgi:hypothetical protein